MSENYNFNRANYADLIAEIKQRGERIKALGEEVEKAWREGYGDANYAIGPVLEDTAWNHSRAKRIAEGLE